LRRTTTEFGAAAAAAADDDDARGVGGAICPGGDGDGAWTRVFDAAERWECVPGTEVRAVWTTRGVELDDARGGGRDVRWPARRP
jgi:hypothetical protein